MIEIKNRYHGSRSYFVSDSEWQEMKDAKKDRLFEVVRSTPDRPLRTPEPRPAPPVPDVITRITKGNTGPKPAK